MQQIYMLLGSIYTVALDLTASYPCSWGARELSLQNYDVK
jgi:hypothetical protein